ncbi:MAG: methyltransferase domain-containing protein [Chloroflexi bacterium]|nr:methyltransferase domain-containing protein [Chloroflexota bacterium]
MTTRETWTWKSASKDMDEAAKPYFSSRTASHEAAFFLRHLKPGMSLLDCGCSEGSITVGLAGVVAPGHVTGIDIRANAIREAKAAAAERGITNVTFQVADASSLPFPDGSFDAVFAHALLEWLPHLKDRIAGEMHRVLRPRGVVGLRSPAAINFHWPRDEAIDLWAAASSRWQTSVRKDMQTGLKLVELLRATGFEVTEASVSASPKGTPEGIRADFMANAAILAKPNDVTDFIIQQGWLTKEELKKASDAYARLANHPEAYVAHIWGEAVAKKPG